MPYLQIPSHRSQGLDWRCWNNTHSVHERLLGEWAPGPFELLRRVRPRLTDSPSSLRLSRLHRRPRSQRGSGQGGQKHDHLGHWPPAHRLLAFTWGWTLCPLLSSRSVSWEGADRGSLCPVGSGGLVSVTTLKGRGRAGLEGTSSSCFLCGLLLRRQPWGLAGAWHWAPATQDQATSSWQPGERCVGPWVRGDSDPGLGAGTGIMTLSLGSRPALQHWVGRWRLVPILRSGLAWSVPGRNFVCCQLIFQESFLMSLLDRMARFGLIWLFVFWEQAVSTAVPQLALFQPGGPRPSLTKTFWLTSCLSIASARLGSPSMASDLLLHLFIEIQMRVLAQNTVCYLGDKGLMEGINWMIIAK